MTTPRSLAPYLLCLIIYMVITIFSLYQLETDTETLTSRIEFLEAVLEDTIDATIKMRDKLQRQYDTIFEMYQYEMSESTAVNRDREESDD